MQVRCFSTFAELTPYAAAWDQLAGGVPMRGWSWLANWWRHYGEEAHRADAARSQLCVLGVFDPWGTLAGVAPWYLTTSSAQGRVLQMLGDGEVCSDYLSVLCRPGVEKFVARALAEHLATDGPRWDLLCLAGVDAEDEVIGQLAQHLAAAGNTIHDRPGPNCWRIALPGDWDQYLAMLSKSHRKQVRRLEREMFATGRAVLHLAQCEENLPHAAEILIDLHQRRRETLGEPGRFHSPAFAAFHCDVMLDLLRRGQLRLYWLEVDGRPAAAEYQLAGGGVVYAYQSGVDPERLEIEPGRLITLATIRRAIDEGCRAMDFLRGDEPYKAHWRAEPRATRVVRVVPRQAMAQLRHRVWLAGNGIKRLLRGAAKPQAASKAI